MKKIGLTRGMVALVDDVDFEALSRFSWYASLQNGVWYARRAEGPRAAVIEIYMHRQLLDAPDGVLVDRRNRNGLDNPTSEFKAGDEDTKQPELYW